MRVELTMRPTIAKEQARIAARSASPELDHAVALLASIGADSTIIEQEQALKNAVIGMQGGSAIIVQAPDVYIARTDKGTVQLVTAKGTLTSHSRLYELEHTLGNDFIRISKSAIVNLNAIDRIEPGFGGAMSVRMHDGSEEWISRRYLRAFKRTLGM